MPMTRNGYIPTAEWYQMHPDLRPAGWGDEPTPAACTACDDEGTVECVDCDGTGVLDDDGDEQCDACDAGSVACPCGAA